MPLPHFLTTFLKKKNKGRVRLCTLRKSYEAEAFGFAVYCRHRRPDRETSFIVCSVLANSPAERSGLRYGDRILEVGGKSVFDEPYQATVQRLKAVQELTSLKLLVAEPEKAFKENAVLGLPTNVQLPGTVAVAEPPGDTDRDTSCETSSERRDEDSSEDKARYTSHTMDSKNVTIAPADKDSAVTRCADEQRGEVVVSPAAGQQSGVIMLPVAAQGSDATSLLSCPSAEQGSETTLSRSFHSSEQGSDATSLLSCHSAEQGSDATSLLSFHTAEQASDTTSSLSFHTAEQGSDVTSSLSFYTAEQEL